jgi:hypothetical protein
VRNGTTHRVRIVFFMALSLFGTFDVPILASMRGCAAESV